MPPATGVIAALDADAAGATPPLNYPATGEVRYGPRSVLSALWSRSGASSTRPSQ